MKLDYSRSVAPMINQSDAPFRTLCLKYGATCAYSEMISAHRIVEDEHYLDNIIPATDHIFFLEDQNGTCNADAVVNTYSSRPLIAQICGNDPDILGKAVAILTGSGLVDAVDFNLGCPQDRAKSELFGSYLLDSCHWNRVFACVNAMSVASNGKIPIFCKIRICEQSLNRSSAVGDCVQATIDFCRGLVDNGADLICIHGRTRGSTKFRRCGPANLSLIQAVASHFSREIPIIANGNIVTPEDVEAVLTATSPSAGIMSAEGLLADPALFSSSVVRDADRFQLFEEYCKLSQRYEDCGGWSNIGLAKAMQWTSIGPPIKLDSEGSESHQIFVARQHLTYMLGKVGHGRTVRFRHLGTYKKHHLLLMALKAAAAIDDLIVIARDCLVGVFSNSPYDPDF